MKFKNIKMYSLSDGKFIVSYFDPIKSKRVQKNFDDEEIAKLYLNKLKTPQDVHSELSYLRTASTDTAVRVYLEQVPNSYLSRTKRLVREFSDFFSAHGVPRLTEKNLREFFVYLKNELDLGDRTLLAIKSQLQGFFKFLITHQAIESSPLDDIKFNRGAPYRRKPIVFSDAEIRNFVEHAKKHSTAFFYPIFLLIQETAVKRADIMALRWKDINFNTYKIEFKRSNELQPREFEMSQALVAALRNLEKVSDFVFTNLENQPLRIYIMGRELKKFQKLCGFETNWNLIDLRFSFGINFLKIGGEIKALQKILGHKTVYNTIEIYGRYDRLSSNLSGSVAVQESGIVS